MNPQQFERWQDFSLRMARTCFKDSKEPPAAWILGTVEGFFSLLDPDDVATFESWDNSGPYAPETGFRSDRPCACRWKKPPEDTGPPCRRHTIWQAASRAGLDWERVEAYERWTLDWEGQPACTCPPQRLWSGPGDPDPECKVCGGDLGFRQMANGQYVCDIMSETESEDYPGDYVDCGYCTTPGRWKAHWRAKRAGLSEEAAERYAVWRSEQAWWDRCTCAEDGQERYEAWVDQWYGPVHCCVRAGIDFAADPSAGVVGFTAGNVRAMYPEGVPEWVFDPEEKLGYWLSDRINGTFPELPDDAGVLL